MAEASLVVRVTAEDKYSEVMKKLSAVTKAFSKDTDELENTLIDLSRQKGPLNAALKEAKKQLAEAEEQFNETKNEASALKLELAQAQYDGINRNLKKVTQTAKEAEKQFNKLGRAGGEAKKKLSEIGTMLMSSQLAKEFGASLFTTSVSSAWIDDSDAVQNKAAAYYTYIVRH